MSREYEEYFIIILYIFSENEEYFHKSSYKYLENMKNIFIIILYISREHKEYFDIHTVHI